MRKNKAATSRKPSKDTDLLDIALTMRRRALELANEYWGMLEVGAEFYLRALAMPVVQWRKITKRTGRAVGGAHESRKFTDNYVVWVERRG